MSDSRIPRASPRLLTAIESAVKFRMAAYEKAFKEMPEGD
jgi:hypothetical protein